MKASAFSTNSTFKCLQIRGWYWQEVTMHRRIWLICKDASTQQSRYDFSTKEESSAVSSEPTRISDWLAPYQFLPPKRWRRPSHPAQRGPKSRCRMLFHKMKTTSRLTWTLRMICRREFQWVRGTRKTTHSLWLNITASLFTPRSAV